MRDWTDAAAGAAIVEQDQLCRSIFELHHDLRQPLAAINALVAAGESQPDVPEIVRSCLERIGEEARELLALCRHVLEQAEEPRLVSVSHLAESVAQSWSIAAPCRLHLDLRPAVAVLDEIGFRRALWNLLDNASRAAGPSGDVLLRVDEGGGWVRVSVGDSGAGFTTGPPGEASLGLGIVNTLARKHGGQVEIGESDLGGALVTLALPTVVVDLASQRQGAFVEASHLRTEVGDDRCL